jgi:nitric oxide reductase NorD protein
VPTPTASSGGAPFSAVERRLAGYLRALWGRPFTLRPAGPRARVSIDGSVVRMPDLAPGHLGEGLALHRAAAAHAAAHLAHSTRRFPLAKLRPIQVALVSLLEDARIERLAWRDLPGLRRLWLPFHVAGPDTIPDAVSLMARLARALIDPDYRDHDGWVVKGRELFEAEAGRLDDPSMSREIGVLLGNDLGQMRLRFDHGRYLVEPAYRDDNTFLWEFPEDPSAPPPDREPAMVGGTVALESGATSEADRTDGSRGGARREISPPGAVPATEVSDAPPHRYPEWDYVIGVHRPAWCTVRERLGESGDAHAIDDILARHEEVTARVTRLVRNAQVGHAARLRRQVEGNDLDLDAAIAAVADLRAGRPPSPRVYQRPGRIRRDLAVLWLLDLSRSTNDLVPGAGETILALAREATAVVAEAIAAADDAFALHGFNSSGRQDVDYYRFKDFDEPYAEPARARLAAMTGERSTRMGAALRHAGHLLSLRRAARKLIVLVTDGAPHDIDVHDRWYLVFDAKRAVEEQRRVGIATFCVSLDPGADAYVTRIFGAGNYLVLDHLRRLPEKLALVYLRWAAA